MVFIPRTYVRAAGIQSEIGKMSVNKIAYLQNDCRRMIYMAKMDMKKTLREMKHSREMARRSIGHYRRKLREYQIVKQRKYLVELDANPESFDNERKKDNPASTVKKLVLPEIYPTKYSMASHKNVATKSFKSESINPVPEKRKSTPNEQQCQGVGFSDGQILLEDQEVHLPPIHTENRDNQLKESDQENDQGNDSSSDLNTEVNPATELNNCSGDILNNSESSSSKNNTVQTDNKVMNKHTESHEIASVSKALTNNNSQEATVESNSEDIPKVPKRRRTGAVNLARIMRLQYSTNLKALFKTVDALAKVHGINGAVDREISAPRRISKLAESRRISEDRRISRTSVPGSLSGESDTRRLSQVSGPRRPSQMSDSQRTFQLSHERRLSRASDEQPKHLLPSEYLYNMKYGYLEAEETNVEEVSNAGGASVKKTTASSGAVTPSTKNTGSFDDRIEKESRKVSRISVQSSPFSSRRVSTVSNPISSSQFAESSESRPKRPALRGDRTMAKVSQSSLPQPYSDDYFERAQREPDKDVAWRTAFRMLKHVHFIDSSELIA